MNRDQIQRFIRCTQDTLSRLQSDLAPEDLTATERAALERAKLAMYHLERIVDEVQHPQAKYAAIALAMAASGTHHAYTEAEEKDL